MKNRLARGEEPVRGDGLVRSICLRLNARSCRVRFDALSAALRQTHRLVPDVARLGAAPLEVVEHQKNGGRHKRQQEQRKQAYAKPIPAGHREHTVGAIGGGGARR